MPRKQIEVSRRRPTLQLEGFGRRRTENVEDLEAIAPESQSVDPDGCPWKPVVEEGSGDTYYWNINTGETTWIRPAELGGTGEESANSASGIDDSQPSAVVGISKPSAATPVERKPNKKLNNTIEKEVNENAPLVGALESLGGYESESASEN